MKTGLKLYKKYRKVYAFTNLFLFYFRKFFIGFDVANQFIQRVDKFSVQLILKVNGAIIGKDCDIETGLVFHNCKNYSNLSVGDNCHIGKNCFFDLKDKIIIGNNVVISMQCSFITHIDMTQSKLSTIYPSLQKPIIISENVYIGANSIILMGVNIGKNSLVAAGSVIQKDVSINSFVGGVPAKEIKKLTL
ncbi:MAG TPA: acyltransferase [Bacteroidales bacterium]|nr:acyltransferase [Bacteroidales bacterium]